MMCTHDGSARAGVRRGGVRRGGVVAAALAGAVALSGCVHLFPSPIATDSPASSAPAAREGFLPIAPLTWSRGDEVLVELAADGTLRDHGVVFGKLGSDGAFATRDGVRRLVMATDGSVHVMAGMDVQLADDGTATTRVHGEPDDATTLEDAQRGKGGKPPLTLKGDSPALRRTAMWALMIPDLLRIQASQR